jgi:hypothetical protein
MAARADGVVLEWLQSERLIDTWECLQSERMARALGLARGADARDEAERKDEAAVEAAQDELTVEFREKRLRAEARAAFASEDADRFFSLWSMFEPAQPYEAQESLGEVSFRAQLYFYTSDASVEETEVRDMRLSAFLHGPGAQTARRRSELFAFFALPHVDRPREHEQFRELYAPVWRAAVAGEVEAWLAGTALRLAPAGRKGKLPELLFLLQEQEHFRDEFRAEMEASAARAHDLERVASRLMAVSVKLLQELTSRDGQGNCQGASEFCSAARTQLLRLRASLDQLRK